MKINKIIPNNILEIFNTQFDDVKFYLVGGTIRDLILNRPTYDRDIVVLNASAIEVAKKFADLVKGYFVLLDETYDIARVVLNNKEDYYDFALCQGKTLEEDLKRRDFTINALAYDLKENNLIDIFNSKADLDNAIIRSISEKNLIEDPVRILRAYRFQSNLDFYIDANTQKQLQKHISKLNIVAKERINQELIKLLEGNNASLSLLVMYKTGVLEEIMPYTSQMAKVPPNSHHHLALMAHSIESARILEETLRNPKYKNIIEYFDKDRLALLKFATLMHDVGKFETWEIQEDGRHRFISHDRVGSDLIKPIMKELKFSRKQIAYVSDMIRHHIYPSQILQSSEVVSEKALNRFFRKLDDIVPDLILLAIADRLSTKGPEITQEIIENNLKGLDFIFGKYIEFKNTAPVLEKIISGDDLIEVFNLEKGPIIGKLLNKIKEAQIVGDITNKEQALELAKDLLYNLDK